MQDIVQIKELLEMDVPIPRYTSYPTAPVWGPLEVASYKDALLHVQDGLSLYIHIPFCKTMCLYCGCSVILNRKKENEDIYVEYLLKEIALVAKTLGKKKILQLHFGGGTPTKLTEEHFDQIMEALRSHFSFPEGSELAIEIDPRTVDEDDGKKLSHLKRLGFTRVSFGVQDTDEMVQKAVKRYQSYDVTKKTFLKARHLGFDGINIDLIYGLPYQTTKTFQKTIEDILALSPDRIALFSYAKVPWLKPHQKAIKEEWLPASDEKFQIYVLARKAFIEKGYQAIGMDHFAKAQDSLSLARKEKTLSRNFQGYTVLDVQDLVGLGITSIGRVNGHYFQNAKDLQSYYQLLDTDTIPVLRGKLVSQDDTIRRWVIERLMCDFELKKNEFCALFDKSFDEYFKKELSRLLVFVEKGFVEIKSDGIFVTMSGELFIRNIASCFDWYLHQDSGHKMFSKSI